MNRIQIVKGNKLILESKFNPTEYPVKKYSEIFYEKVCPFHKDWNILMDAVRCFMVHYGDLTKGKGKNLFQIEEYPDGYRCIINCHKTYEVNAGGSTPIEAVWNALVSSVKWHNKKIAEKELKKTT